MTVEEKIKMYSEKKVFIDALDAVFKMKPTGSLIEKIKYEVYQKEIGSEMRFKEWLVLYFEGGAMLAAQVTGNSNIANLRAIPKPCGPVPPITLTIIFCLLKYSIL